MKTLNREATVLYSTHLESDMRERPLSDMISKKRNMYVQVYLLTCYSGCGIRTVIILAARRVLFTSALALALAHRLRALGRPRYHSRSDARAGG